MLSLDFVKSFFFQHIRDKNRKEKKINNLVMNKKIKFKTESEIFSKIWGRKNELFNSFIKKELLKFDEK